jgi:hypothetical protein
VTLRFARERLERGANEALDIDRATVKRDRVGAGGS